jgi:hypothetical protein
MTVVPFSQRIRVLLLGAITLMCALWPAAASAQAADEIEAKVKSSFLLNFARYVEWPPEAFVSSNSPVVIGVLGDTLGRHLDSITEGRMVEAHPIQVKRGRRVSDLAGCHVIFIGTSERDPRPALAMMRGKPILTVSDLDGFIDFGGVIQLKRRQGTMRFDINREAADKAGLKISSKLLKLADNYRQ